MNKFNISNYSLVDYVRPVIIFGPYKELLNDQLLNDRPTQFANCVPRMLKDILR
jgi:hypothetical protein